MKNFYKAAFIVLGLFILSANAWAQSPPSLISPNDDATNVSRTSITFSWTAVSGSSSNPSTYAIQVNDAADFLGSFIVNQVGVSSPGLILTPTSMLPANKTFYWRVKANVSGVGFTAYSSVSKFTTTAATAVPVAAFSASTGTTICPGESVSFSNSSTGGALSYSWTFSGGTPSSSSAAQPTVTYTNPGTYTVVLEATNALGSNSQTRTGYITVKAKTAASITVTGNLKHCPLDSVTLTNSVPAGSTYTWSNGKTDPSFNTVAYGTISLYQVGANGCRDTASVTLARDTIQLPITGSAQAICKAGDSVNLLSTSAGPFVNYKWNGAAGTTVFTAKSAGLYTVTALNSVNQCPAAGTFRVNSSISPVIANKPYSAVQCNGDSVEVFVNTPSAFSSFTWSNSNTHAAIKTMQQGSFFVNVVDTFGCASKSNTIALSFTVKSCYIGKYNVGSGQRFSFLNDAIDSLAKFGMGGPVTLSLVPPLVFSEDYKIGVTGNLSMPLTIESANGNRNSVVLDRFISDTVFRIIGNNKVTFRNLTIDGKSTLWYATIGITDADVTFDNCVIKGHTFCHKGKLTVTGSTVMPNDVEFSSMGLEADRATITFTGNTFIQPYPLYIAHSLVCTVTGNTFSGHDSSGVTALIMTNDDNEPLNATITRNIFNIDITSQNDNIYTNTYNTLSNVLVANNNFNGTVTFDGFATKVYNNNFLLNDGRNITMGSSANNNLTNKSLHFANNNVKRMGTDGSQAYLHVYDTANLQVMSNNNYYCNFCGTSAQFDVYKNSTANSAASLTQWKTITKRELNTLTVDPNYVSNTNLKTQNTTLSGKGIANAYVTDDVTGFPRGLVPTIGSYEINLSRFLKVDNIGLVKIAPCVGSNSEKIYVTIRNTNTYANINNGDTVIVHLSYDSQNQDEQVILKKSLAYNDTTKMFLATGLDMTTAGKNYAIKAVVEIGGKKVDSSNYSFTVQANPTALFNTGNACAGVPVLLKDSSISALSLNYIWTFPDGTSTLKAPQKSFSTSGTKTITLKVYTTAGCQDQTSKSIEIYPLPDATVTRAGDVLTSAAASSYQWYLNGALINGQIAQTLSITQSGTYKVKVTNSSGCEKTSDPFDAVKTGISEVGTNGLLIYPNPASDVLQLEFAGLTGQSTVRVYDMNGRQVFEKHYHAVRGEIHAVDVKSWTDGMYLMELANEAGTARYKFMVKK